MELLEYPEIQIQYQREKSGMAPMVAYSGGSTNVEEVYLGYGQISLYGRD